MSDAVIIALITAMATLAVGVVSALAKRDASLATQRVDDAERRVDDAERKADDHEERLERLEPAFGDGIAHIRDLRGHINRGDPPPPPPLPGSLVHYYYD